MMSFAYVDTKLNYEGDNCVELEKQLYQLFKARN